MTERNIYFRANIVGIVTKVSTPRIMIGLAKNQGTDTRYERDVIRYDVLFTAVGSTVATNPHLLHHLDLPEERRWEHPQRHRDPTRTPRSRSELEHQVQQQRRGHAEVLVHDPA
jgi:hypothetical protein